MIINFNFSLFTAQVTRQKTTATTPTSINHPTKHSKTSQRQSTKKSTTPTRMTKSTTLTTRPKTQKTNNITSRLQPITTTQHKTATTKLTAQTTKSSTTSITTTTTTATTQRSTKGLSKTSTTTTRPTKTSTHKTTKGMKVTSTSKLSPSTTHRPTAIPCVCNINHLEVFVLNCPTRGSNVTSIIYRADSDQDHSQSHCIHKAVNIKAPGGWQPVVNDKGEVNIKTYSNHIIIILHSVSGHTHFPYH